MIMATRKNEIIIHIKYQGQTTNSRCGESVGGIVTKLQAEDPGFECRDVQGIFLSSKPFRLAMRKN